MSKKPTPITFTDPATGKVDLSEYEKKLWQWEDAEEQKRIMRRENPEIFETEPKRYKDEK